MKERPSQQHIHVISEQLVHSEWHEFNVRIDSLRRSAMRSAITLTITKRQNSTLKLHL